MGKKNDPTIATHDSDGNLTGSMATKGKTPSTVSAISAHPAVMNKPENAVPFVQRWAALGEARKCLQHAEEDLLLVREMVGEDGVAPGQCVKCHHPHHLSKPLALNLGQYTTTSVCEEKCRNLRYDREEPCLCSKSVLASEGQAQMYRAEQKVLIAKVAVKQAEIEVNEPRVNDCYFVVRGLRSRNKHGYVVLTKEDKISGTKVLLEFRNANNQPASLRWFPLRKLERSLAHIGFSKE
jgi:hypothetical protein